MTNNTATRKSSSAHMRAVRQPQVSEPAPASVRRTYPPDPDLELEVAQFRAQKLREREEVRKAEAARVADEAARAAEAAAAKSAETVEMVPAATLASLLTKVEFLTQKLEGFTAERAEQAPKRRGRPPGPAKAPRNMTDKSEFFAVSDSEDYNDTALNDIRALLQLLGAVRVADVIDHKITNHLGRPVTPSNARRWLNKLVQRDEAVVGPEFPKHLNGEGWRFVWAKDEKTLKAAIAGKIPTPTDVRYMARRTNEAKPAKS